MKTFEELRKKIEQMEKELEKKLIEETKKLDEVRQILREEDRDIVNTARLLERLQKVTNYKKV